MIQKHEPSPELPRPTVRLVGHDGNAFAILGACNRAATKAGWTSEQWAAFREAATGGDYDQLLMTVMKHFDVE